MAQDQRQAGIFQSNQTVNRGGGVTMMNPLESMPGVTPNDATMEAFRKSQGVGQGLGGISDAWNPAAAKGIAQVTPLFYNQMAALLARGGQTDPQYYNDQMALAGAMGQGQERDMLNSLAEMGMQRSFGGQAQLGAIRGGTANQMQGINTQREQDSTNRLMQLLAMLSGYSTDPALGSAGIVEGGRQFDANLKSQEGDRIYQLIGAGLGAAGTAAAACWVARAVYGADNPRWLLVRQWMLTKAPLVLRWLYLDQGPALAEIVKASPELRETLEPAFEGMIAHG